MSFFLNWFGIGRTGKKNHYRPQPITGHSESTIKPLNLGGGLLQRKIQLTGHSEIRDQPIYICIYADKDQTAYTKFIVRGDFCDLESK